jgi:short-subunit dehydrogenase
MHVRDSVVVITGASSGIGRATALRLARHGASLVLAARRGEALHEVATECERHGVRAIAVPIDVSDEQAVNSLARRALSEFGRIDVWFNNAGVAVYAPFEDVPINEFHRVLETNLFGYVYGARAVIPIFKEQGHGTLIMNVSGLGHLAAPYVTAYTTSKFAIRGLCESLRQELRDTRIHVCTLSPGPVDTPFYQHAANHLGVGLKPLKPVIGAERIAKAVESLIHRPRPELAVAAPGRLGDLLHALMPRRTEHAMARKVERQHFQRKPAPTTSGALFAPGTIDRVSGGWRRGRKALVAGVGAAIGGGLLLARARHERRLPRRLWRAVGVGA